VKSDLRYTLKAQQTGDHEKILTWKVPLVSELLDGREEQGVLQIKKEQKEHLRQLFLKQFRGKKVDDSALSTKVVNGMY
jgi:uncharacterized protein YnzC (UPF0291/DUF896 family)